MRLSRRSLLSALCSTAALGTVGAPWLLRSSPGIAGAPSIPKRILFLHVRSGSMPGRWEPVGIDGNPPTETEWDVNPDLHGALAPYRNDLCYFQNLDFVSEYDDPTDPANAHLQGGTHCMSAAHRGAPDQSGGPTIDQVIAQTINTPAPVTRLPSLEISYQASHESIVSASSDGTSLPRLDNPVAIYDRLFPDAGMTPSDTNRLAERRQRSFALIKSRYEALAPRLGGIERQKLEQQLASVADLENRLALSLPPTAEPPPRSILDSVEGYRWNDPGFYRASVDLDIRLAAAALHADVTRVITLEIPDAANEEFGYTPGQWDTTDAHDLIHKVMDIRSQEPLSQDPEAIELIRQQHLRGMEWVRQLLDDLAERTESDGQRLLDHTVVVYVSQIADGSHCLQGFPWFTVGSCGGALRTGRYFQTPRDTNRQPTRWITPRYDGAGRSHSDLFVSLAQAMGLSIDTFGHPGACTGPIEGFNV